MAQRDRAARDEADRQHEPIARPVPAGRGAEVRSRVALAARRRGDLRRGFERQLRAGGEKPLAVPGDDPERLHEGRRARSRCRSTPALGARCALAASRWRPLSAQLRWGVRRLGHVGSRLWPGPASARAAPLRTWGWHRLATGATLRGTPVQEDDDGHRGAPDLSAALLGVADPIDDDREPRGLRAHVPDLGGRSVRGDLHRPGRRLLRGASPRRLRADHHRRHDHPPRGALLGVQLPRPLEGRPGRRASRASRRPCTATAASSRCSSCTPACAPCPCSRRIPRTTSTRSGTWSRRARSRPASTRTRRCRRSSRSTRSRTCSSAYADAARRAIAAGLDGVEYHMSHGYLPWQFLSPLYNHRTDGWGGSYENRLRFPVESMTARARGDRRRGLPRLPHQLDLVLAGRPRDGRRQAHRRRPRAGGRPRLRQPLRRRAPLLHPHADDLRAGLGARLHEGRQGGVDEARPARRAASRTPTSPRTSSRPTRPTRSCSRASCSPTRTGRVKARDGQADDIRRCVAANYCWRSVIRGGRVQCVYNAEVGRERKWGSRHARRRSPTPKKVLVIGGRPLRPRVRAHRRGPRARRRRARARGRGGRPRPPALPAAGTQGVRPDRAAGCCARRPETAPQVRTGADVDEDEPRRAARRRAPRPRRRRHRLALPRGRLAGPDRCAAAGRRDGAAASPGIASHAARSRRPARCSCSTTSRTPTGPLTAVALARGRLHGAPRHALADDRHGDDPRGLLPLDRRAAPPQPTSRSSPTTSCKQIDGASVELINVYAPDRVTRRSRPTGS